MKRARHLYSGVPPLGISTSSKPCRVAEDELRQATLADQLAKDFVRSRLAVRSARQAVGTPVNLLAANEER